MSFSQIIGNPLYPNRFKSNKQDSIGESILETSKFSRYLIWKEHGFCPRNTTYGQRKQILNKELDPNSLYKDP